MGYVISDFDLIDKTSTREFSPEDCWKLNEDSRTFLKNEITASFSDTIVVITQFFPHPKSIHPKYKDHGLNPYFCCNCEDLMSPNVPLWIHGHTHESIDYFHKGTHVIANPRGYYSENTSFNEKLVVEV